MVNFVSFSFSCFHLNSLKMKPSLIATDAPTCGINILTFCFLNGILNTCRESIVTVFLQILVYTSMNKLILIKGLFKMNAKWNIINLSVLVHLFHQASWQCGRLSLPLGCGDIRWADFQAVNPKLKNFVLDTKLNSIYTQCDTWWSIG